MSRKHLALLQSLHQHNQSLGGYSVMSHLCQLYHIWHAA
jgi:hypothetical protein